MAKYVYVQFNEGYDDYTSREYAYKGNGEDCKPDDFVVVGTRNGYKVAKVSRVTNQTDYKGSMQYIIQRLDMEKAQERINRQERLNIVLFDIEERAQEIDKLNKIKALADSHPDIKALVQEYEELSKEV